MNPSLVPGGAGESEIPGYVTGWADAAGLATQVLEATAGRPSVVVRGGDRRGGRTLMLCGHLDTVGGRRYDRSANPADQQMRTAITDFRRQRRIR